MAVHADGAFFSTCGSSLSVKSAMLPVAEPGEELLISRNAHKSVVAGLVLNGLRQPRERCSSRRPITVPAPTSEASRGAATTAACR